MKFIVLLSILLLSSCASSGPKFESLQLAPKYKALIYIYRPSAFSGVMRNPDVYLNKTKVGKASNGSYFVFEAKPGHSAIYLQDYAGEETGMLEVDLASGQTYFLRIDLSLPTLTHQVNFKGEETGKKCPFQGENRIFSEPDGSILRSMDTRAQSTTCWPGFMFVVESLARRELPETKQSR